MTGPSAVFFARSSFLVFFTRLVVSQGLRSVEIDADGELRLRTLQ